MGKTELGFKLSDMLRTGLYLGTAFILTGCELNRTAEEGFTEVNRSGFPDDGTGSGLPHYESERVACVDRINGFRATVGLPPLQRWLGAETCSDLESKDDSETGTAHGAFGTCHEFAQNECPRYGSLDQVITGCLQAMWNEGAGPAGCASDPACYQAHGHYLNMTNTRYTEVACGFYETPQGEVWAVQNFR